MFLQRRQSRNPKQKARRKLIQLSKISKIVERAKKKCKRSPSPEPPPLVELFTKKWEEDKEERKEDRAMMREELDGLKEVNMEMLGCMKSMANSFSRMTQG